MRYLLDTCVVSETYKTHPSEAVTSWLNSNEEGSLCLSVLTFGELEKGVQKLADGKKRRLLESWIQSDLSARFEGRIFSVDETVARAWGTLQAAAEENGRSMPVIDGLLAATALVHKLIVVTRNNPDMEASGVPLINPWNRA